jgi:hypothetical protein
MNPQDLGDLGVMASRSYWLQRHAHEQSAIYRLGSHIVAGF